jgi:hypothetical protein
MRARRVAFWAIMNSTPSLGQRRILIDPASTCGVTRRRTATSTRLIVLGSRKEEPAYRAIENICKGPELELPDGIVFTDRDGKKRSEFRIAWWQQDLSTYRRAARVPNEDDLQLIPDLPLPAASVADRYVGPPVMFGHYWFDGTPAVISDQFACLDYSAANQGPLVAYRWDGESKLSSVKLAWV